MNKKQSKELGKIFVAWNLRELESSDAMYKLTKVFPRIFLRAWRKYCSDKVEENSVKRKGAE